MIRRGRLLGGILSNWASVATSIVVAFFLSPFVVHRLGDVAYGIWTVIGSAIAYMTILDLGLRGAVLHFVSINHAKGEHGEAGRAVSAALGLRLLVGLGIVAATVALAVAVPALFQIPPGMTVAARAVVLLTGTGLAVTLTCGVFGAVLVGLQRFDLLSGIAIAQSLAVAAGTVAALRAGSGIVGLAVVQFVVALTANAATVALAFRQYPELRIRLSRPAPDVLRRLGSYSFYFFLITVTGQVIYYTDNLVVGTLVSAEAVTLFAIGGRLIEYHRQLATGLAQALMPVAGGLAGLGRTESLHGLLVQGTRLALVLSWTTEVVLFFRGETFIGLWMGPRYAHPSGVVMRILLLSNFFIAGNHVSANICFGLGKHRPFALWQLGEAVANIALSVILVRPMGLYGVAWGTTLPSLVTQMILWPWYISKVLGIGLPRYLWQAWARTALALAPFAVANYCADRYWTAASLMAFFLQVAALLPLVAVGLAACFWAEVRGRCASVVARANGPGVVRLVRALKGRRTAEPGYEPPSEGPTL